MPLVIPSGAASIAQIFVDAWALSKLHRHTQLSERTILINLAKIADSTVNRPCCALPRMIDTDLTAQPVLHSPLWVSTQRDLVSRCAALCAHVVAPAASDHGKPVAKRSLRKYLSLSEICALGAIAPHEHLPAC